MTQLVISGTSPLHRTYRAIPHRMEASKDVLPNVRLSGSHGIQAPHNIERFRVNSLFDSTFTRVWDEVLRLNKAVSISGQAYNGRFLERVKELYSGLARHDQSTAHHSARVAFNAYELGRMINLEDVVLRDLVIAALLHDIGKEGVPVEILQKPGKPSDEEWKKLQAHTTNGVAILNGNHIKDKCIVRTALEHHLYLNHQGGYPKSELGRPTTFYSKVIEVLDVYDALTSNDRAYKEPWSEEEALKLIVKDTGKQFHPDVVKAFLKLKDRLDLIALNPEIFVATQEEKERAFSPKDRKVQRLFRAVGRYLVNFALSERGQFS